VYDRKARFHALAATNVEMYRASLLRQVSAEGEYTYHGYPTERNMKAERCRNGERGGANVNDIVKAHSVVGGTLRRGAQDAAAAARGRQARNAIHDHRSPDERRGRCGVCGWYGYCPTPTELVTYSEVLFDAKRLSRHMNGSHIIFSDNDYEAGDRVIAIGDERDPLLFAKKLAAGFARAGVTVVFEGRRPGVPGTLERCEDGGPLDSGFQPYNLKRSIRFNTRVALATNEAMQHRPSSVPEIHLVADTAHKTRTKQRHVRVRVPNDAAG